MTDINERQHRAQGRAFAEQRLHNLNDASDTDQGSHLQLRDKDGELRDEEE